MPPRGYKKPQAVPQSRPQAARTWEYHTLSSEKPLLSADLNAYGVEGWELVSVYVRFDAVYAVFKREVQS